jgi:ABC-type amino acid transport system permease subunit
MRQLMRNPDGSNRGTPPFNGYRPADAECRSSSNLRSRYSRYNGSILAEFAFQEAISQNTGNAYLFDVARNRRLIPNGNTTQLIWALAFVRAVGLGPLAGVLAITAAEIFVLAKLFAEAIENADPRQPEAIAAVGGGRLLAIRFGILPQVLPVLLAQTLYSCESNTRSAAILGVVGAGGIGLQIAERIKVRFWDEVSFIIILILATVALIDIISSRVRRRLID